MKLITGPVGSGKTAQIIEKSGRIVVPTESVAREMRQRVLEATGRPLVGDVVTAWPHFIRSIAGAEAQPLNSTSIALVLMPLLGSHPLRYFRANTISWGIARSFAHTILMLKHNLIDPKTLRAELETRGSLKENDLLTVYERYEEERQQRGLIDEGDVTLMAYDKLKSGDASFFENIANIAFDEWYHVTPGMRAIVAALKHLKSDTELMVSLPSYTNKEGLLRGVTSNASYSSKVSRDSEQQPKNNTSQESLTSLVTPPRCNSKDTSEVKNSEPPFAKSWERTIATFERIADEHIKLPTPSHNGPKIKSYILHSPSAETHYLARELANMPVIARRETTKQSRCNNQKTRSLRSARDDNEDCAPRDDKIAVILRAGDDELDMLLAQCARHGLIDSDAVLSRPMDAPLIHRLFSPDAIEDLPETATLNEYVSLIMNRARETSTAALDADDIREAADRPTIGRTARALFMLTEKARALATRANLLMHEPISRSAFIEIMREQLNDAPSLSAANSRLPFSAFAFEHPPVSRLTKAFVPHMVEGHLPQATAAHLFFGDMEEWGEAQTDSILDEIFINSEEQLAREAGLFHALLSKCEQSVVCTLPLIGSSGSETAPSSFLDSLEAPTHIEIDPDCDSSIITDEAKRKIEHAIAIEFERARGECETPAYHGIIAEASLQKLLKQRFTETRFSPTSLERFAACPFQFFVQKVLNLEPEEEVSPEILPKDRGTIVHSVLEKFYRHHLNDFRAALTMPAKSAYKKLEGVVDALVDEVFRESASLISYASPSLDDYQRRGVTTMTWQVIKMELVRARDLPDPLFPTQCEWVFGRTGETPLELPVQGDKPALIKGIVDRIDANSDASRFAIADYKTGRTVTSVRAKMMKGQHLQLPIYVMAAKTLLYPDAVALGGVLIGVQMSEKDHGFLKKEFNDINYSLRPRLATLMDDDMWDSALDAAREHIAEYVKEIRAGRFPTEPAQCNDNCDFKDVCRYHERAN